MPYKCLQRTKVTPTILLMEFCHDVTGQRYFRAVIQGWRNFKFQYLDKRPGNYLDKTLAICRDIDSQLTSNPKSIEDIDSVFTIQ